MSTELVVLEVAEKNYPKIYCAGGLDAFYQKAKAEVEGEVPDISTRKGRDRIATLAADVSRSKTAVEKPGRAYNKFLKAQPKLIDKELREYCDKMDQLRDDTRAPLTDWETIDKAEKKQIADTAAYLIKFAADVEEGYRDNELFDLKAKQAEADRQAEIKAAVDKAASDAKAKAEAEAAEKIAQANRDRIEVEQKAAAEIERVKREKKEALDRVLEAGIRREKAEREAVEAQNRMKWVAEQAEQRRIELERQAKLDAKAAADDARDAEIKRQQDEADRIGREKSRLEADKCHTKGVKIKAFNDFMTFGLDNANARLAVQALAAGKIDGQELKY